MFSLKAHRKKRNNILKRVQKSSRRGLPKSSSKNLRSKRKTKSNKSLKMWKKGGSSVPDSEVNFEEVTDLDFKHSLVSHFRTSTTGSGANTTDDVRRFYRKCPPEYTTNFEKWNVLMRKHSENNFVIKIELDVPDYAKLTGFFKSLLVNKSYINYGKKLKLEKPYGINVDWKN